MEIRESEQRRADNLIWNAAGDYSFCPWLRIYDPEGRAELYWNTVLGSSARYYDRHRLQAFADRFGADEDRELYETVFSLALENSVRQREEARMPGLALLREDYARRIRTERIMIDPRLDALIKAWFSPEDGSVPLPPSDRALLAELRDLVGEDTDELLSRVEELLRRRLEFVPVDPNAGPRRGLKGALLRLFGRDPNAMNQLAPVRGFAFGFAEHLRDDGSETEEERRAQLRLPRPTATRDIDMRSYVTGYFGPSLYSERETLALERSICTGNHRDCHLHFTRGAAGDPTRVKGYAGERRAASLAQEAVNRAAYDADIARNRASIQRLTERLQNSVLSRLDQEIIRGAAGSLDAGRVWRATELNDEKVFLRSQRGEPGALAVDILLDSSTSQLHRQKTVAAQGYIIAESLTRCHIPVRVYSFCSMNGFTILNMFRDLDEPENNRNIFRYFTAGCNRDGLAVRAAAEMLMKRNAEHRILILLSDARPNDVMKLRSAGAEYKEYIEAEGIADTAAEVHQARVRGIQVVCVFTGTDDDLPAAKTIYGQHMTRIRSIEQFADAVSALLQAQIAEM